MPLVAVLALAFTVRVSKLGDQAIWWDEAWSILLAEQSLPHITHTIAIDAHPPLYQWALHVWIQMAGISEFAARYFSVLAGVVTVALSLALARRLTGSRHAALVAGGVTALSVIGINWSQEARMYALGAMWSTLAVYAHARLVDQPSGRWAATLALAAAAAPLSQYLAGFAVVAVGLHAVLTQRTRAFWRWWLPAMVTAGVAVGAWLLYALTLATRTPRIVHADWLYPLRLWWAALVNGTSANLEQFDLPALLLVGLVALGGLAGLIQRRRGVLLALLLIALPPLFYGVVNRALVLPLTDRYYSLMAPTGLVGVVACLYALARVRRLRSIVMVAGAAFGLFGVMAVWRNWDERHFQDDYATLIRAVDLLAQPDDTILFISGDRYPLIEYPLRKLYHPAPTPYRVRGVPHVGDWESILAHLTSETDRAWLVFIERSIGDPDGVREAFLRRAYNVEAEVAVDHNGYALLTRRDQPTYPDPHAVLPPTAQTLRPHEAVRVGVPAGMTATLRVGDVVLQQAMPSRWEVVSFRIYPSYPNGDYTLTVGDQRFGLRVTHAQPPHALHEPIADFGVLRLHAAAVEDLYQPWRGLRLRLLWEGIGSASAPISVFAHVTGPWNPAAGNPVWGQHDGLPAQTPLHLWYAGMAAAETRVVYLPPLPQGRYELRVGLYNWQTGERLRMADGEESLLLRAWTVE